MSLNAQMELYQQVILEHNKNPRNYKEMIDSSHHAEGFNPLCGDHFWVYLKIDGSAKIDEVTFKGDGCAISKASASMMTVALKGKTVDEARKMIAEFTQLVRGEMPADQSQNSLGKLNIFSGIWKYPSRVKCAVLACHAAGGAFSQQTTVSSE